MTFDARDDGQTRSTDRPLHEGSRPERPLAEGGVSDEVAWAVVDAAPDGIVVVDDDGVMLLVNSQLEAMFGYDRGELLGRRVEHLIDHAVAGHHQQLRSDYQMKPSVRPMGDGNELRARRQDGSTFVVEISLSPVAGPDGPCTVAAVRDVTRRVEAEAEVRAVRERTQLIDDRERVARDLHDTVIHDVFAVGMGLQSFASTLTDERAKAETLRFVDELDGVINRIRSAIFDVAGERIELEDSEK